MKISKILFGAAILFIAAAVFSCKEEESLSLMGTENVKNLQAFKGDTVRAKEVDDLLMNTLGNSQFEQILSDAFDNAYKIAYASSKKIDTTQKSTSTDVKLDDVSELKKLTNVDRASIKGKVSVKASSNKPIKETYANLYSSKVSKGDYLSQSGSGKITYAITDGFYQVPGNYWSSSKYFIAGYITIEITESGKNTVTDATNTERIEYSGSSSSTTRVAASVSIYSDSGVGGKFTLSSSSENSGKSRSADSSYGSLSSDIVVYDNNNKKVFTIRGSAADDYLRGFDLSIYNVLY